MSSTPADPFSWADFFKDQEDLIESDPDKIPVDTNICPHCGGKIKKTQSFRWFIDACEKCGRKK